MSPAGSILVRGVVRTAFSTPAVGILKPAVHQCIHAATNAVAKAGEGFIN